MIDLKLLQKEFENVSAKLTRKGVDTTLIEELKTRNEELKVAKKTFEELQALQNSMSKEFGIYKREGKDISSLKAKVDANKVKIADAIEIQRVKQEALESLAMSIPNMPDDNVPDGADENENVEIKKVLTPKEFSFTAKEHWELAEQNGWIDFERGVKPNSLGVKTFLISTLSSSSAPSGTLSSGIFGMAIARLSSASCLTL